VSRILLVLIFAMLLAPVPEAAAATFQVHMSGYAYGPAQLSVKVGDTVTWTNHDQAAHDAVVTSGPAQFRSPLLSTGESWSFTFAQPGTYSYYCSVHPDMRAQVVVAQPAAQAPAAQAPPVQQQQQQTPKRQPATTRPTPTPTPTAAVPAAPVAAAPGAAAETVVTAEPEAVPPAVAMSAAAERPTLDPLLLVAGLVAAVATLCLLLIGSRSTAS
jgi:plastocyanin